MSINTSLESASSPPAMNPTIEEPQSRDGNIDPSTMYTSGSMETESVTTSTTTTTSNGAISSTATTSTTTTYTPSTSSSTGGSSQMYLLNPLVSNNQQPLPTLPLLTSTSDGQDGGEHSTTQSSTTEGSEGESGSGSATATSSSSSTGVTMAPAIRHGRGSKGGGDTTVAVDGAGKPIVQYIFLPTNRDVKLPLMSTGGEDGTASSQYATNDIELSTEDQDLQLHADQAQPVERDGKQLYACVYPGCTEAFSKRFSLKRHIKKHIHIRPFACVQCGASFAEKSTLIRHSRTHDGTRPFKCPHPGCERDFADRTNVRRHILTHTGEKPWVCPHSTCARNFTRRSVLRKHLQARHNNEGLESIPAAFFQNKSNTLEIPINEGQNPHVQLVQADIPLIHHRLPQLPTTSVAENGIGRVGGGADASSTQPTETETSTSTSSSTYVQPSAVPLPTLDVPPSEVQSSISVTSTTTSTSSTTAAPQSYSLTPPQYTLSHNVEKASSQSVEGVNEDQGGDEHMKAEDNDNTGAVEINLPPLPMTELRST